MSVESRMDSSKWNFKIITVCLLVQTNFILLNLVLYYRIIVLGLYYKGWMHFIYINQRLDFVFICMLHNFMFGLILSMVLLDRQNPLLYFAEQVEWLHNFSDLGVPFFLP